MASANTATKTEETQAIQIQPLRIDTIELPITGLTPLVTHNWSEKALSMMRDAQQGRSRRKKEPKDQGEEYESAFYRLDDGSAGIPAAAFKSATVQAARNFEGVTMTSLKSAIFVVGEGKDQLVRIVGEPEMWESPVRVGMGTADLRYRPRFFPWSALLVVRFNTAMLTREAVVNLVNAGGLGGVGEWRPSAPKSFTGSYGMFEVSGQDHQ